MYDHAIDIQTPWVENCREIDEGIVAGAQPLLSAGLAFLLGRFKIKTDLNLRGRDSLMDQEERACQALGIRFVNIHLPDLEVLHELPEALVEQAMEIVNDPANRPLFIHCKKGADRTGAIVGCYRVQHGWTLEQAMAEMKHYHNSWVEFGMRDTVEDYLKRMVEKNQTIGG